MHHPSNSLIEMHKHCEEKNKFYYDGPGTDIVHERLGAYKYLTPISSIFNGNTGNHSVYNNYKRALNKIELLNNTKEPLDIYIYGYSRGAISAWVLKNKLLKTKKLNIKNIFLFAIDPSPGSFIDRIKLKKPAADINKKINVIINSYYSYNGNITLWDMICPFKINLPLLSAFKIPTGNCYILKGNHEDVAGHSRNLKNSKNIKRIVGDLVIADIITKSKLKFNQNWQRMILYKGMLAMQNYLPIKIKSKRKFLTLTNFWSTVVGSSPDSKMFKKITLEFKEDSSQNCKIQISSAL